MPILAEFSEREYELAMNIELLATGGQFSVPSQTAEKHLGYDVALVPGLTAVWANLGYSTGLPGVASGRGVLGHPSAPAFAASLFLQYKRPEKLRGSSAKEAKARRESGVNPCLPYLRYRLERDQLSRLVDLHHEVGPLAEVCYAAACLVSLDELRELQAWQSVMRSSNFLPLGRVATALPHGVRDAHVWTYSERGSQDGVLCSEPTRIDGYRGEELLEGLATRIEERSIELWTHVYELAQSLEAWDEQHGEPGSEFPPRRQLLSNVPGTFLAAWNIESIAKRQGLNWFLAFPRALRAP